MALNKRSITNGGLFTFVFGVALGVTSASGAPLREELTDLLGAHPLIRSGQAQVQSADQGVRTSLSPFLPNLSLRGEIGRERLIRRDFVPRPMASSMPSPRKPLRP